MRGTSSTAGWPGVALQLFISHTLAAGAALGAFWWLASSRLDHLSLLLLSCTIAGMVGILLTTWLQYNLYVVEIMLTRFAQGLPVETLATTKEIWRWPLSVLFRSLNQASERLKDLAHREQLTQEYREQVLRQASEAAALEERNRIARDLHDSIKQQIFSISMSAAAAKAHWDGSSVDACKAVEDIQSSAREAQVEMQALLQQLRAAPLENTSLMEALHTQAQALGFRTGADVEVKIADLPDSDLLPAGSQETIFRMVQEAFANIARHARAHTVCLRLYQEEAPPTQSVTGPTIENSAPEQMLHIEISDDGQGFDLATVRKGMGMANLYERARALRGTLAIEATPGKGTRVHACIPLLEPLHTRQELERSRRETQHAFEQASWGFQLSANASLLTAGLLFINIVTSPFAINLPMVLGATLGCLAALYGYISGRYFSIPVRLSAGANSLEALSLREEMHNAHIWFLRLLLIGTWFLFGLRDSWQVPSGWGLVLAATLLLLVAFIFERQIIYHVLDRRYKLLPETEAQWEVQQKVKRSAVRRRWGMLPFLLLILNWSTQKSLAFPPTTPSEWGVYALTLGMVGWGLILLIEYLQTRRWQRTWQSPRVGKTS